MLVDEQIPQVLIGDIAGDNLTIRVLGREYPDADDFGDGNWLSTLIDFSIGQFNGTIASLPRVEEFQKFRDSLVKVSTSMEGEATFNSMEDWLTIRVSFINSVNLLIAGSLIDKPGSGNRLNYVINGIDQSYLASIIGSLNELLDAFPAFEE